jgi:hypothetical protein
MGILSGKLQHEAKDNQKSEIDDLYEKLHPDEKLDLFNIQYNARSIMHNATKLEGEADELGYKLSDKMKTAVWEEFYENANKQSQILKIS